MAEYIEPKYIRCDTCGIVMSESESFSNLSKCNKCDWKSKNPNSMMVNPFKPDLLLVVSGSVSNWDIKAEDPIQNVSQIIEKAKNEEKQRRAFRLAERK